VASTTPIPPRYGPDWGLRFNVTFLYPTAKQHSEPDTGKD